MRYVVTDRVSKIFRTLDRKQALQYFYYLIGLGYKPSFNTEGKEEEPK